MRKSSSFRKILQKNSPRFVGELVYGMAFKGFQLGVQAQGGARAQVWARNSYRQGNWVPFLSDIDLSVWTTQEPDAGDIQKLRKTYSRLKSLFPVLGEINLYVATESSWVGMLINRFELERDPQLATKITASNPLDKGVHAATFLLRMLESDIEQVLEAPEGRRAKWDTHFERVTRGLAGEKKDLDIWKGFPARSLLRGILELVAFQLDLPDSERNSFIEQLELYFHAVGKKIPVHVLAPQLREKPFLWAALPHRFCFRMDGRPELAGIWLKLAQAQICWELFGMLTQHRLADPGETEKAALKTHLESLSELRQRSMSRSSEFPALDTALGEVTGRLLSAL